ncbi:hypothetical protein NIES4103_06030 [Nostoc sp. NIES-4103]|nr:hypothetical protein NIES4103_06030 [Nostoc sp. NIES-4103]
MDIAVLIKFLTPCLPFLLNVGNRTVEMISEAGEAGKAEGEEFESSLAWRNWIIYLLEFPSLDNTNLAMLHGLSWNYCHNSKGSSAKLNIGINS